MKTKQNKISEGLTQEQQLNEEWIRFGSVGVDSGQLMITDPCYLGSWKDNEVNFTDKMIEIATGKIIQNPRGKPNGYEGIYKDGMTYNEAVEKGIIRDLVDEPTFEYSYDGACKKGENHSVELGDGAGICFNSGFGDGCYEVWGLVKDYGELGKRVKEVKIILIEDLE
jgi:hypothetical protein